MASMLTEEKRFDQLFAVAPDGHFLNSLATHFFPSKLTT